MRDRGLAHTLEALTAGLIVLGGVVFALGATGVTPLSASTSNEHLQNQQRATADGLLRAADSSETLVPTLVFWNRTRGQFHNATAEGYYVAGGPPTAFGAVLNRTFRTERIAFNVELTYHTADGKRGSQRLVYMGTPSDNAVAASRTVPLFDDQRLVGAAGNVSAAAAAGEFYAPDAAPESSLFNLVEVRIVVWRM